jgi:hypothetical protein
MSEMAEQAAPTQRGKRSWLRGVSCAMVLVVLACGGDDDGTDPLVVDVNGTWLATVDFAGEGTSCSSTDPTTLSLTQTGSSFSGTYSGGEIACTSADGTFSFPGGTGQISNGAVNGATVSFDLGGPEFRLTGTASDDTMEGTGTWEFFGLETGPVTLTGSWEATRP